MTKLSSLFLVTLGAVGCSASADETVASTHSIASCDARVMCPSDGVTLGASPGRS